jgi:hypothetical protein
VTISVCGKYDVRDDVRFSTTIDRRPDAAFLAGWKKFKTTRAFREKYLRNMDFASITLF